MGNITHPLPVKLICGIIANNERLFLEVEKILSKKFGPIDVKSQIFDFNFTDYYEKEMGAPLSRRLLAFKPLIQQDALADIKIMTNKLELAFCHQGKRQINIDPGYLLLERFVLASGKNFAHRIYLGQGIYADLTLIYRKGAFRELPWTYPDYADEPILGFLAQVRRKYRVDLIRLDRDATDTCCCIHCQIGICF